MGCFKPTVHGLGHLPELVLSVRSETPFLSRNSTWRAPEANKGLTVTPTAHQPCTQSRLQDMKKRKNSVDVESDQPISSHPPGLRWHSHTTTVGPNSCQKLGSKGNASFNSWGLRENDHKTIYYFWTKTLIRLSRIGRYCWYLHFLRKKMDSFLCLKKNKNKKPRWEVWFCPANLPTKRKPTSNCRWTPRSGRSLWAQTGLGHFLLLISLAGVYGLHFHLLHFPIHYNRK